MIRSAWAVSVSQVSNNAQAPYVLLICAHLCRLMIGPRVGSENLIDKTGSLDIYGYHKG